jgi:hypothetical protein
MLAEFIVEHRDEIITRCRNKVTRRESPPPTDVEIDHGVPMFLDELLDELRLDSTGNPEICITAGKHGHDLFVQGFTPSQVVHDYGDVCQTITEMAVETNARIGADYFRKLNRCLDDAIASAITEHGREREAATTEQSSREDNRMSALIDEMRVTLLAVRVAFEAIQTGNIGAQGTTGTILARRLKALEDMNERMQLELHTDAT